MLSLGGYELSPAPAGPSIDDAGVGPGGGWAGEPWFGLLFSLPEDDARFARDWRWVAGSEGVPIDLRAALCTSKIWFVFWKVGKPPTISQRPHNLSGWMNSSAFLKANIIWESSISGFPINNIISLSGSRTSLSWMESCTLTETWSLYL